MKSLFLLCFSVLDNNVMYLTRSMIEPSDLQIQLDRMNSFWFKQNKVVATDSVTSYHWGYQH